MIVMIKLQVLSRIISRYDARVAQLLNSEDLSRIERLFLTKLPFIYDRWNNTSQNRTDFLGCNLWNGGIGRIHATERKMRKAWTIVLH